VGPMGPTRMQLDKPVIAAIEGYAVAGGLELALWCDLRVAAENATLGVFNRRFGVPLIDLGTVRLPRMIGPGRALDLILTGRPVPAVEAHAMGLVERLVAPGTAAAEAHKLAAEIAGHPQSALRADRRSVLGQWSLGPEDAMLAEHRGGLEALSSGEAQEGARTFAEGEGRHGKPRR
jgi:enoyl-CoA hydratase